MGKEARSPEPADVALFLPKLEGGGAERITLNLARGLRERGHAVDLVVAVGGGSYAGHVPEGVRLVEFGARRSLMAVPALVRYLGRHPPAAFLSALNHANIVALWAARWASYEGSLVVAEHNDPRTGGRSTLKDRFFHRLMRWFYPWADRVIAVSQGVKEGLEEAVGLAAASVEVIYNPVITPEVRAALRERPDHPFFAQPPVVLAVGRLTRQKNFAHLLRAFALLRQDTDVRLVILGEGELRQDLERQVASLGLSEVVSMPGFVANPYAYLSVADLFVLSSDWEGLPTVLIEALAAGTPIVATDCRSGPREILKGGRHGTLVPVGDSGALADAMRLVLSKGRCAVDDAVVEPYSLETVTLAYERALGLGGADASPHERGERERTDRVGADRW